VEDGGGYLGKLIHEEIWDGGGGVGGWDRGRSEIWRRELGVEEEGRIRERKKKKDFWRGMEGRVTAPFYTWRGPSSLVP
jgi:hypothetical protein